MLISGFSGTPRCHTAIPELSGPDIGKVLIYEQYQYLQHLAD